MLAAAFAGYGPALAAGALLLGRAPLALAAAAVVLAGVCGPLLTGGMSSRLAATAGEGREGWDALSYGLGGTGGPALVALATAVTTPLTAVLALSAATGLAAVLTRTLPHVASRRRRSGPAARPRGAAPADHRRAAAAREPHHRCSPRSARAGWR